MTAKHLQKHIGKPIRIKARMTTGGIHLFNRATGTNVLIDEIRPSPTILSKAPRQVSIALTNACDLFCEYCYAPKSPANLPFEDLKSWLLDLDQHGSIGVGFGGGEPTLYPKFLEICEFATVETNLAVTFTTHAHRLTSKVLRILDGNVNFVRVSMDGVGATYEANRGRNFDELIKRIESLSRIVAFGINYVVNSETISDLDAAIELAAAVKAREFLLLLQQPTTTRSGVDDYTKAELSSWINRYRGTVPLAVNESNTDGLPTCDPIPLETGLAAYAHINATGILKRNSYDQLGVEIEPLGIMGALQVLKDAS